MARKTETLGMIGARGLDYLDDAREAAERVRAVADLLSNATVDNTLYFEETITDTANLIVQETERLLQCLAAGTTVARKQLEDSKRAKLEVVNG